MRYNKAHLVGVIVGKFFLVGAGCIIMRLSFGEAPPLTFDPFAMICGIVIALFGLCSSFEDW